MLIEDNTTNDKIKKKFSNKKCFILVLTILVCLGGLAFIGYFYTIKPWL